MWLLLDFSEHDLWHIIKYHRAAKANKKQFHVVKVRGHQLHHPQLDPTFVPKALHLYHIILSENVYFLLYNELF